MCSMYNSNQKQDHRNKEAPKLFIINEFRASIEVPGEAHFDFI